MAKAIIMLGLAIISYTAAIRLELPPNGKRCLKEEIHKDKVVKGEFEFDDMPGHHTTIRITDARDHLFYENSNNQPKGVFAFSTEEYDLFEVCLTNQLKGGEWRNRGVSLNIKHGSETQDYDMIAKAEKLKPLEQELRRLEDLSENIVNDFAYMRQREEEMRDTNESTHTRVLYFSVFSMLCLIGLATWQVLYLRKYFKSKKLID